MATATQIQEQLSRFRSRLSYWRAAVSGDPVARVLALPRGVSGYADYERIRQRGPLVRGRSGLYVTASYEVCNSLLRSDSFGAMPTGISRSLLRPTESENEGGNTVPMAHPLDDSFPSFDPPDHTRLRKAVSPWFMPQALRSVRTSVERIITEELEALPRGGPIDLMERFAIAVPGKIICDLLDLPEQDCALFVRWGLEFSALIDGVRTPGERERAIRLYTEMSEYFAGVLRSRRGDPGDDVLSHLAALSTNGDITEREAVATGQSLLIGGFITTANVIGTATSALLAAPERREEFTADLTAAGNVVEEALRLEAPAQYCVRTTRERVSLAGHSLPAGTPVIALLAAANRDPAVFPDPDSFDITRPNARDHLAFAAGIHYCIGAGLARMEAEVALTKLFEAFPRTTLDGDTRYVRSRVIRGPSRLVVRLN